ncbi:ExbD/TolR family protein [Entomobacter blattae]|uniref:Biopolymer transport protein ExbD n=1 Tax=Entomobacter blattae TaxID=2762277 RepID=A0A7H1NR89_9PROT|nr:biopolymer transporter ExbD [Entomobacter blattae]QNT78299.1 Biopolymer transport protein ExbD [Entomobacter blattae]
MSMNIGLDSSTEDEPIVDINTTPLIDVMLVLLIMLIVTIPLQTESVQMALASGNQAQTPQQPEHISVVIDFDSTILWNGQPVANEQALTALIQAEAAKGNQPVIEIHPDRLANYTTVAGVLAHAQKLGLTKITIRN